jgi:hypothetical protein
VLHAQSLDGTIRNAESAEKTGAHESVGLLEERDTYAPIKNVDLPIIWMHILLSACNNS